MKLKKGDNVIVISGKDRGKKGKITQIFSDKNRIVVDGINKTIKHVKPRKEGEKGQRVEFFGTINASNVMLVCSKCSKSSRIGTKVVDDNKKQRICRKCKEAI